MISSYISQLSTEQQLMVALEKARSNKLRDKQHSTSHSNFTPRGIRQKT